MEEKNKKGASFKLHPKLQENLGVIAQAVGTSKTRLIEDALDHYFGTKDEYLEMRRQTVLATIKRLGLRQ